MWVLSEHPTPCSWSRRHGTFYQLFLNSLSQSLSYRLLPGKLDYVPAIFLPTPSAQECHTSSGLQKASRKFVTFFPTLSFLPPPCCSVRFLTGLLPRQQQLRTEYQIHVHSCIHTVNNVPQRALRVESNPEMQVFLLLDFPKALCLCQSFYSFCLGGKNHRTQLSFISYCMWTGRVSPQEVSFFSVGI